MRPHGPARRFLADPLVSLALLAFAFLAFALLVPAAWWETSNLSVSCFGRQPGFEASGGKFFGFFRRQLEAVSGDWLVAVWLLPSGCCRLVVAECVMPVCV